MKTLHWFLHVMPHLKALVQYCHTSCLMMMRNLLHMPQEHSQELKKLLTAGKRRFSCHIRSQEVSCLSVGSRIPHHKLLSSLFGESKEIPPLASARIQRWALTLSDYCYSIRYKAGKTLCNADALNRLPRPVKTSSDKLPGDLVQLVHHLEATTVNAKQVKLLRDREIQFYIKSRSFYYKGGQKSNNLLAK